MPSSPSVASRPRVAATTEPYVGPRPFGREDQEIFFGRSRETIEVTSLLKAHTEVLLYAQSGAGKTSLVYAQLIPTLEGEEEFQVLPPARVRSQQLRTIPDEKIRNIYMFNALRDLSDDKLGVAERAQITLAEYLSRIPRPPINAENPAELRLARAIIFDQFEEIFTLYQDRYKDRQDFFGQVAEALEADPFLRVVFSMREDYIAELDPYIDVLPQKLCTRFRLERLRKKNALAAVTKPLKVKSIKNPRKFAAGAAESLVDSLMLIKVKTATGKKEVAGEFVDPVQLQVVCQTLWEKLPPAVTTIEEPHLEEYANVDEALLTYYENSIRKSVEVGNAAIAAAAVSTEVERIPIVTEGAVRRWFEGSLITREGKRNMAFRGEKKTGTLRNEVVDELDNQHLIRAEMRGDDTWYELSHDRFISPIKESNYRWIRQQPLAKQLAQDLEARAAEYKVEKGQHLLLDRAALLNAKNWRQSSEAEAIGCSPELESLIRESEAAIEREDRNQLELIAYEQKLRANAEHHRARQFKLGLVLASLLLVVALSSSLYAFRAKAETLRSYKEVVAANSLATKERKKADEAAGLAIQEKNKAEAANDELVKALAAVDEERLKADAAATLATQEKEKAESANTKLAKAITTVNEQRNQAINERTKAQTARDEAQRDREDAITARGQAERYSVKLENEKSQSLALKLASDVDVRLPSDPELGLRLALEAVEKAPNLPEARYSLRQAYFTWPNDHYILSGHREGVQQGIFSRDGKVIITTSRDATVNLWEAKNRTKLLPTLEGHKGEILAADLSFDSTRLATEAADGTGRIWWLKDGSSKVLSGLTGEKPAVAFSRDGKLLATEATAENNKPGCVVDIWDAEDPKNVTPLFQLHGLTKAVSAVAFSPVDDYVVAGSLDSTARVWNAKTGTNVATLIGHREQLNTVVFDPSGNLIVTGSDDGTARIWETRTGKQVKVPLEHFGRVTHVAYSHDGNLILTLADQRMGSDVVDNVVRVWDAKTGRLEVQLSGHTGVVKDASFSTDDKLIVSASEDGTARVWNTKTGEQVMELRGHSGTVSSAVFSPDGTSVLTTGLDHTAQIWRIPGNVLKPDYFFARKKLDDLGEIHVQFNSNSELVTTGTDGEVRVWNAQTLNENKGQKVIPKRPLGIAENRASYLSDLARSPDGRYIVMALRVVPGNEGSDKEASDAYVWDNNLKNFIKLSGHNAPIYRVVYSPKGKYVLTASDDGTAILWDTTTWKALPPLKPRKLSSVQKDTETSMEDETVSILDAAFDPDETKVVTGHQDGSIQLWEIATGKNLQVIHAHKGGVLSVAFSAGGNLIVTGSSDETAALWTLDGKNVVSFNKHTGYVTDAEFSDDDSFIITASSDNTVRVWENNRTGAPVAVFKTLDVPMSATLSPDNKYIAIGGLFGFGQVFQCQACRSFDEIKELASRSNPRQLTKPEKKSCGLITDEELPDKK